MKIAAAGFPRRLLDSGPASRDLQPTRNAPTPEHPKRPNTPTAPILIPLNIRRFETSKAYSSLSRILQGLLSPTLALPKLPGKSTASSSSAIESPSSSRNAFYLGALNYAH